MRRLSLENPLKNHASNSSLAKERAFPDFFQNSSARLKTNSLFPKHMRCFVRFSTICAILKKREKQLHRSVTFSTTCNFTKSNTPPWVFLRFLNCTNGTKSRKASHLWAAASDLRYFLFSRITSDICNKCYYHWSHRQPDFQVSVKKYFFFLYVQ